MSRTPLILAALVVAAATTGASVAEMSAASDAVASPGAAAVVELGPALGAPIPHDLNLPRVAARSAEFAARGLSVVFVSYDGLAEQEAFAGKQSFEPALLSDAGLAAIEAFGLRNKAHAPGSRAYGVPHPAVFVLDREGVVVAKFYESDFLSNDKSYRNRPAVDVILQGAVEVLGL